MTRDTDESGSEEGLLQGYDISVAKHGNVEHDDDGGGDFDPDAVGGRSAPRELNAVTGYIGTARLIATLIKSFIGSGVLFLPQAFANGGWLFSSLVMVAMAVLTQICIMRLIECRKLHPASYGRIGRLAVGAWGEHAVNISLVLSQAGFGTVYVVFIARNVLQLLNADACWLDGSHLWMLIIAQFVIFVPLTWIRRIGSFGPTNIAADVLIFTGLVGILIYSSSGLATRSSSLNVPMFNSNNFSLFLGTAVYAYEGLAMVVPVYDSLTPAAQVRNSTDCILSSLLGTEQYVPDHVALLMWLACADLVRACLPQNGGVHYDY